MSNSAQEHLARISKQIDGDITLRDYFAAQILNGHIASPFDDEGCLEDICKWAYEFADTMLAAREQGE